MATVLSLKELRNSSTLKTEIRKLEEEKQKLLDQLEHQKQLEKKLRDDITSNRKDFDHLEKQFEHFAGIEADYDVLQHEVQMERLEKLIDKDKDDSKLKNQLKKARAELRIIQDELKNFKQLDPIRLKRQVVDLKKKTATQTSENKTINKSLLASRKELREITVEKDKLDTELKATRSETDYFWQSKDGEWSLFETALVLKNEATDDDVEVKRVKCLNMLTGASVVSKELGKKDLAVWHGAVEFPEEVSKEAGKRLKANMADAEND